VEGITVTSTAPHLSVLIEKKNSVSPDVFYNLGKPEFIIATSFADLYMDPERFQHPSRPRLALRAGITGHRPVPGRTFDVDVVSAAISDVFTLADASLFRTKSRVYDSEASRRFTLVSALAPGADQLAAEQFAKLANHPRRQCLLEVVLPFSLDDYAKTIKDARDAERMRALARLADRRLILSDFCPSFDGDPPKIDQYRKNRRYETVGRIVIHQADFLIALWNGLPSEGLGGTADIVVHAVRSEVPVVWINLDGTMRLVPPGKVSGDEFHWIQQASQPFTPENFAALLRPVLVPPHEIPDEDESETSHTSYQVHDYLKEEVPESSRWGIYNLLLAAPARRLIRGADSGKAVPRGIRGLLSDARESSRLCTDYVRKNVDGEWKGFPSGDRSGEQIRFARAWAAADAIATGLGHAYRSTYVVVLVLSFAAVASGLVGVVFHEKKSWFVSVELLVLSCGLYLYSSGRRNRLHERWLQTRQVAEQLRATWSPSLLGMGGRRSSRDGKRHWAMWLTNAYLAEAGLPMLEANENALLQIAEAAVEGIAKDQGRYHAANAKVLHAIHHRLERVARRSLIVAICNSSALLLVLLVRHFLIEHFGEDHVERVILAMAAISAMLPALGATAAALRYQGDFDRFSKRSLQTSGQLHKVSLELDQFIKQVDQECANLDKSLPKFERLLDILIDLENGLMSDLEDWRFVYVTRDVPEPG
jgi:hypothetical protein